jgi:hypothetical protein
MAGPPYRTAATNSAAGLLPVRARTHSQECGCATKSYARLLLLRIVLLDNWQIGRDLQVHDQLQLMFHLEKAHGYGGG